MEKDERIKKLEDKVKEFIAIRREMKKVKDRLSTAQQEAEKVKTKLELYSKLEKAAGVKILASKQTAVDKEVTLLKGKFDELSKKEAKLENEILTSISDESKFPFGIAEPIEQNEDTIFPIKDEFQIETDVLKTIFELLDVEYPAIIGEVVVESTRIAVRKTKVFQAVNKVTEVLESIRTIARTLSEMLSDEAKLQNICDIIHSSEKSYRPVVEEIGKHYPHPISRKEIAKKANMRPEAVASICSMLYQGKKWAAKCSILKKPEKGYFTFNRLGRRIWSHYERLYKTIAVPQKLEKEIPEKRPRNLLNFA